MRVSSVALLLAMTTLILSAQSQPSKTPKVPDTTEDVRASSGGQPDRATGNQQPGQPAITVVVPDKNPQQLADERSDRQQDRAIQTEMLRFNGYLVLVGVAQILGMVFGLLYTARAANAAKRAADVAEAALVTAERAYLTCQHWKLDNFGPDKKAIARWVLRNSGRTPGWIIESRFQELFGAPDTLPEHPKYHLPVNAESGMLLAPDTGYNRALELGKITAEQHAQLESGTTRLWIWGYFRYRDGFSKTPRTTSFVVVYQPGDGLVVDQNRTNYHHTD